MNVIEQIGRRYVLYGYGYHFPIYWHKINGPAFFQYKTTKKQQIEYVEYWLYGKEFYPWWII